MSDATEAIQRGIALRAAGRAREAADAFRAATVARPDHVEAWCRLAEAAEALSELATAAQAYEAALLIDAGFAEAWCNYGSVLLKLGRPADAEKAFRAALRSKPQLAVAWNGLGVALKATGNLTAALTALREAVQRDPNYGQAHFNLGNVLFALERPADAVIQFAAARRLSPRDPAVLQNLSGALYAARDFSKARDVARELLAIDPPRPDAHNALGNAELALGHFESAEAAFRQAIALRPNFVGAITNLGNTLLAQNRLDAARQEYERAAAIDPTSAEARFNPSIPLLLQGDLVRGLAQYEHRLATAERKPRRRYTAPAWSGAEEVSGKTLFVHYEQGVGDTLQFVRYIPALVARGAHVVLEVQAAVASLFAAWGGVTLLDPSDAVVPPHDFHVSLLSLPQAFGTDLSTIPATVPYVSATSEAVARWKGRLATSARPRIGLACSGNPKHKNDHNRSIALADLRALPRALGARVHLVQTDLKPLDATVASASPEDWLDWSRTLADFADTAGLLQELDLVITVDTSLAHLAGALGRPVWILLPFAPDWRWMLERADSPWYPTARLYRQHRYGDWSTVIGRVAADLAALGR